MPEPAGPDQRADYDHDAEAACLGGILLKQDLADEIFAKASPDDFHDPRHRLLAETLQAMATAREPLDLVTLTARLRRAQSLERAGGPEFMTRLLDAVPTTVHVVHYAGIVRERALQRSLADAGHRIVASARDPESTVEQAIDRGQQALFDLNRAATSSVVSLGVAASKAAIELAEMYKNGGAAGWPTGFTQLDHLFAGGLHPNHLIVVGGRPGAGKTAFVLSLIGNMAMRRADPVAVAMFSLEMGVTELCWRIISADSLVPSVKIKSGRVNDEEINRIIESVDRLRDVPVYLNDESGITIQSIVSKTRRLVHEKKVKVVILDYVGLLQDSTAGRFPRPREQFIAHVSRSLKLMARELGVCVVALVQLNREVDKRTGSGEDREPKLSDIRESGALEQDADQVVFLHKLSPGAKDGNGDPLPTDNLRRIIVAKNRHGQQDGFYMQFIGERMRFENHDPKP